MKVPNIYRRLQQTICIYDFLALLPLALPWVIGHHLSTLGTINQLMGGGAWTAFEPIHFLFVQLLGVIGTGWTAWRWLNISHWIGIFEGFLRLIVASVLISIWSETHHPILLALGLIDIAWGLALIIVPRLPFVVQSEQH